MKFESIALLVQEKKFKIDFQHGRYGNHLGFLIRMTLAFFDLQVTLSNFELMGLSIQGKKFKIYFQDATVAAILYFQSERFLAIFDLQVTSTTLTKFQVNWLFGSEKKRKIDFQDGCHLCYF